MKKAISFIVTMLMVIGLFAQSAESTGLTDKDVKNFAKNYQSCLKELEKITSDGDISNLEVIAAYAEIEAVFERMGVSGPNRTRKVEMIVACMAYATLEEQIDAATLALYKSMGMEDPLEAYRPQINEKDYKIVKANYKALAKALEMEE